MLDPKAFTPPAPGVWELESTHLIRPVSRSVAAVFPAAATEGFRRGMQRYGMLLEGLEFAVINRFVYICARGVGAPRKAAGPPPKLVFKLLLAVHPEIRRRLRTVEETFATRRWREDVDRWDREIKPAIARENRALQSVDVRALNDADLIGHLASCFDAASRGVATHHNFNATAMLPIGDFLWHVREWTGLKPSEVLPLFRGASRVSQGAIGELDQLAAAIRNDAGATALLAGSDAPAIVDALVTHHGAVGTAARAYLDTAGVRIATGYDFADLTLSEMPDVVIENIRTAIAGRNTSRDDVTERETALRDRVPAQHRTQFDELLAEARLTYRMRDERVFYNDAWSCGITRRAILAAGERLVARGLLLQADHAVELTPAELASMLGGGNGRSAAQAAADAAFRLTHTYRDAPPFLGGVPAGPPPAEWLPPAAARAERAVAIVMSEMFSARDHTQQAVAVAGFGASPGSASGIARLVLDPADMGRVRKGDILITRATAPSYNALLPLIGAIVTDRGGTLSHAAVVAREYGIPAVVGTGNATDVIRDGMHVRVDGATGTVKVQA